MPTVAGFDFFRDAMGAPEPVSEAHAQRLVADRFGLHLTARSLGSQQDANFLLLDDTGARAVLKIAHPAFGPEEIAAQDAAADLVARAGLRAATVLRGPEGAPLVTTADGRVARLLRHLPGASRNDSAYTAPSVIAGMGSVAARVSVALAGFDHPGLDRTLQWDMRHAAAVVERLAPAVTDPARRRLVEDATAAAWAALPGDLPLQAVHLDLTGDNVVRTGRVPDGVIDFGDLTRTWAVGELAVTLAESLHRAGAEPCTVLPAVRAFHTLRPLAGDEVDALWPLVVLRAAILVVGGQHQVALDPANAYAADGLDPEWRIFEQATSVPVPVMTALLRDALGCAAPPLVVATPLPAAPVTRLDLSVDADAMDRGAWLDPALPDRLAAGVTGTVVTEWGRPRLAGSPILAAESAATVPTGVDVWTDEPLRAPWPGRVVEAGPDRLVLVSPEWTLTVTGGTAAVTLGDTVATGEALTRVDDSVPAPINAHERAAHVQLRRADAPEVPPLVRPEYAPGWLALTADPFPTSRAAPDDLLARREAALASVQEHYYADPPRIERGWRHHLIDADGRVHLDMVNNVTVLGHAHPGVEQAAARQLRRLNTNSRFHYAAVVAFAERLAALLPDPLDTVFLVNSGSEAVDLALRLALAATGRADVVAVREAYHGWTYLTDAVSTSVADNPNAVATRPAWVHTVDAPNAYRGVHRDASRYAPEAVAVIDGLAASGRPPAAFVAEAFFGNAGGVALPDGYLRQVYAAVRRHGGLAVADEVQVGYGRLGRWFWGFAQQGVVPDVVACAKAMGNGHPLGAVVTSRAVAERYRAGGYFFSSTGGSPVSCSVGLAVLDALRDEELPANAARVGARLKAGLVALGERHELIGTVHGEGLYLGVEFVLDRTTRAPATEDTALICDRLRELGVIMQPTGDHLNVLKIKPPLCLDEAGADFFVAMLDRTLTDGW